MPVYNGERYLKEAIDSILNQTFGDFEFIILNDGSTDNTKKIITSYDDSRIVYIENEKNLGIVKTLNKGIDNTKGKYIARMDADDISLPERFEKQIALMERYEDIDICGTWIMYMGRGNIWKIPEYDIEAKLTLIYGSSFAHPTVMIRKKIFDKYFIRYDEKFLGAEDYKMWIDMSKIAKFYNIQEVLLNYRVHNSQISSQRKKQQKEFHKELQQLYLERNLNFDKTKAKSLIRNIESNSCKSIFFTFYLYVLICLKNQLNIMVVTKFFMKRLKGRLYSCIKKI
jgi:glycosyltransferase involved in cell wall biosynthesis